MQQLVIDNQSVFCFFKAVRAEQKVEQEYLKGKFNAQIKKIRLAANDFVNLAFFLRCRMAELHAES